MYVGTGPTSAPIFNSSIAINTGENQMRSAAYNPSADSAYFGTSTAGQGQVVQVKVSSSCSTDRHDRRSSSLNVSDSLVFPRF